MAHQQPSEPPTATIGPLGPDVRVREPDSGPRLIHGVSTSVSAFVGDAPGLPEEPVFVRSLPEFIETFMPGRTGEKTSSFVRDAVLGHFRNGGGGVWILAAAEGPDRVAAYRSALAGLECVAEVTLVVAPDLWRGEEDAHEIAQAIAGHCRRMGNRVALLHTRQGLVPADVRSRPFELGEPDARFAAVYYPWITVTGTDGSERLVPASGHVSGMTCLVGAELGVHRAPMSPLLGVLKHERQLSDDEQESISRLGVNCLRSSPELEQGIRVLGARTLSTDTDWMRLDVRRLVSHARASLARGTRWAASERNDARLRATVRESATVFLRQLWRQGALHGRSADQAFHVVCDDRNNTSEDIAQGRLNLDVGLAAVRPAEFIAFRVQQ
ncbi:phage tail sheath C-terminal domain-containing protein [Streptomyces sp. NL15-2K]|uniref:phage tail sheath family protein n=1 Tax=Streptomyces sp. NL15-2K TaxID=376149 RepID=UPI000F58E3C3|nr:phage tail sheath C-terminal domain-containing protein [Streptomyces sp. NL15-2K]GCB50878.1 phage tail sheath protein FI [Streptomyces sp. NL15-2K]